MKYSDLKKHGDLGIGTLEGLDGEMIALDGKFYQIRTDGKAYVIPDDQTAPFAVVTSFKADSRFTLSSVGSHEELSKALDGKLRCKEGPVALRIEAKFKKAKVRSVPKSLPPYPTLDESLKSQVVFELSDVRGTLVGFRFPESMSGVNVAGYHFHFITEDRKAGGHLLDCEAEGLNVETSMARDLSMILPHLCQ